MNSDPELPGSPPRSRGLRWVVAITVLAVLAVGSAWWFLSGRAASPQELAAKAELTTLGALVVMDPQRTYVNSVNLATLKSPETIDRAIELLPALRRIKSLNVDGTPFRDEHAPVVAQLANLQDLVLSNTAITDAGIEKLAGLSGLTTLYVVNTSVTSSALPAIARLGSLKIIDLSGTKVTGDLEPLQELPDLSWLLARGLSLDAGAIDALGKCQGLTRLTLTDAKVPEEAISQLERDRPKLAIDR